MTLGLIVLLLFCVSVGLMFLTACVDPNDPSFLGIASRFVTLTKTTVTHAIRSIPYVGPLFLDGSATLFNYVAFKPNPLLQLVYAALVFGGYGLVLWEAYPQIPNMYMAGYHRYIGIFVVCGTLWSWYKACTVSPGYITAKNYKEFDNYIVDNAMYPANQFYTYKNAAGVEVRPQVPKLPRSKHDSITDRVVARFDHFCPWLNNPVGERNYRYFLLFLFMTSFMLCYGAAASLSVVVTYITSEKLFAARYVNKITGEVITASKHMVFQYCMHKQQTMMMLFFLCGIMGVVVFCFLMYHVYLVSQNRTTNEGFKWSRYQSEFRYYERKRVYDLKEEKIAFVKAEQIEKIEKIEKVPTMTTSIEENNSKSKAGKTAKTTMSSTTKTANTSATTTQTSKKKKGCCPESVQNFLIIWLHGCFIVSCGMCGREEEDKVDKENEMLYDFSDAKFQLLAPQKYMYKLKSFRENYMEILRPRSQRSQVERKKMVMCAATNQKKTTRSGGKQLHVKQTSSKNGNWSYYNDLFMKEFKKAGEGAKIELVETKRQSRTKNE